MATFQDPVKCFAPLEVIERLLEIRSEMGCGRSIYIPGYAELADSLDAYGFDAYSFANGEIAINFGDYRAPLVPGGGNIHGLVTTH